MADAKEWIAPRIGLPELAVAIWPEPSDQDEQHERARERALVPESGRLTHIPLGRHDGGPLPYLYTLGPLGMVAHPRAYADPDNLGLKAPRSSLERAKRLVGSQN